VKLQLRRDVLEEPRCCAIHHLQLAARGPEHREVAGHQRADSIEELR
jgi:hypothetical protein